MRSAEREVYYGIAVIFTEPDAPARVGASSSLARRAQAQKPRSIDQPQLAASRLQGHEHGRLNTLGGDDGLTRRQVF